MTIDKEALFAAFDNDMDFLKEVIDIFMMEYPDMLGMIKNASSIKDSDTIAKTAHSVKGMVSNFQADTAVEIALNLEHIADKKAFDAIQHAIAALEEELSKLEQELVDIIKGVNA